MKKFVFALVAILSLVSVCQAQIATLNPINQVPTTPTQIGTGLTNAVTTTYLYNTGKTLYVVKNNSTTNSDTITLQSQKSAIYQEGYGTISLSDITYVVPSSSQVIIGPFPTSRFNTSASTVKLTHSNVQRVSDTAIEAQQ